jgi:glutathione S-transferase
MKLIYFNVRGRAQALRYLCADNGVALEEQWTAFADWPALKPTIVFGQLPVLEDGNFKLAQSNAILRYVARKHDLYGHNDHERAQVDMVNDTQEEIRLTYLKMIYQEYEAEKDNYIAKILPGKLELLEKYLKTNHGGAGFFVGSKISFVDYNIFDLLDNFLILSAKSLDAFPTLKGFHGRMAAREKIKKFRETPEFKSMPVNGNSKQ